MTTTAERMYAARAKSERAIGRALVEAIDREGAHGISGMVYEAGNVKGSDHGPAALITLSPVSKQRKSSALAALKSLI